MIDLHAEWLEHAVRRVVVDPPGRHRPFIDLMAVDRDGHPLSRLVDLDQEIGAGGLVAGQSGESRGGA
jgi:pyridoxine/pyridoxamine 5'-phosphate oxidase